MELPPEQAPTGTYCAACFEAKIVPEMQKYDEILERAGNIQVFDTTQGKESRLIKRSDVVYKVVDCEDRDETLMRLAFFAARDGYNTLVDVDLVYEKTRAGSFKIATWSGQGVPAVVPSKYLSPPPSTRRSPSR